MNFDVTPSNISLWSKLGMRAVFGLKCCDLAEKYDNLMVLTADVSTSAGLDRYRKTYPDQYLDVGIAEQNMMGLATGLASEGHKVITTTFAPFQTLRCLEQIKMASYMKQNIIMVGLCGGVSLANLGYSHCAIEDIGVLRSIPGLTILQPADCTELVKMLDEIMTYNNPVYIRLTGEAPCPVVYEADYEFIIGEPVVHRWFDSPNVFILSTGTMVSNCIGASYLLQDKELFASVIDVHTLKPFERVPSCLYRSGHATLVTVEEHSIIGGLNSVVCENREYSSHIRIALPDSYDTPMGDYQFMLNQHGLTAEKIAERIIGEIS